MRISAVNIVNNSVINYKYKIKNNRNETNIAGNSLSETIDRRRIVSFNGIFDNFVTHDYKKNLGLGDNETIKYNKEDGSYIRTVTRHDGSLKTREEYYPKSGKQIITTADKTGTTKVTKTPAGLYTLKTDNRNREVFYEEKLNDGNTYSVTTEYENNRRIEEKIFNGQRQSIEVFDLRTNKPVYSGQMVMKEVVIPEKGIKRIQNILTDAIYYEERKGQNNKILYQYKNYPETDIHSYKRVYNEKTGGYDETYYDKNGIRTSLDKTSKNGKNVETFEFDSDGKKVLKHFERIYNRQGNLETEITYNDASKNINKLTNYHDSKAEVYIYRNCPNVPEYADYFDLNGEYMHIDFQDDGKTPKCKIEYFENNEVHRTEYSEKGLPKELSKTDSTGFLFESSTFYPNGKLNKLTKFNKDDGTCIQETYDNGAKYPKTKLTQGADGKFIELIFFYKGTNIPRETRKYHEDSSYRRIRHDLNGNVIDEKECYPNGREKRYKTEANNSNFNSYTRRKPFIFVDMDIDETKQKKQTPDDQSLNNILNILSSEDKDIDDVSEYDWQVLSRLTGVEDIEALKTMDTKTYRPLAKKFHPDLNRDNPNLEQCNIIMTIINALYDRH